MLLLIIGLLLFFATHSIRIYAEDWRNRQINLRGENLWSGVYSLISLAGLALIVIGYSQARQAPVVIWQPPVWTTYLTAILTLPAFVLLVAAYVPGTKIKSIVGHPMVLGVKLWALAHLLANGMLADMILFGAFLGWSILDYRAARRRDKTAGTRYQFAGVSRDMSAIGIGIIAWGVFAFVLHEWLIGAKPFA